MLHIYTNPALTERLSARFLGEITAVAQTALHIRYNTTQASLVAGETLVILAQDPITVIVTGIQQDTGESLAITIDRPLDTTEALGLEVQSTRLTEPDVISGPGTNLPTNTRLFYIATDNKDHRYREITLGLDREPPRGVIIEFSLDQVAWSKQIRLLGLPSALTPYRSVYRRMTVNRQEPVNLSTISYRLEAEEFLNYKESLGKGGE